MRVVHLFRKTVEQAADVRSELELVSGLAERVACAGALAKVIVSGAEPVDRIAQKAPIEEEITGRLRDRVMDLMTGDRLDLRMAIEVIENVALLDAAVAMVCVEAGEALAEITVEDIFERATGVFQDVIVQDDEAQS